jgi:hypothetical protein
MNRLSGNVSVAALALSGWLLGGCASNGLSGLNVGGIALSSAPGTGVEFERVGSLWPIVTPAALPASAGGDHVGSPRFLMNVAIKNYTDKDHPQVWMKMVSEYSTKDQKACKQVKWFQTDKLAPGKSWTQVAYPVDTYSDCKCIKNECAGKVAISLHPKQGDQRLKGDNTGLNIIWDRGGLLQKSEVTTF